MATAARGKSDKLDKLDRLDPERGVRLDLQQPSAFARSAQK